jgi:putative hemolysin
MTNSSPSLTLSPKQISLARHALGLPNERLRSYRNRYCVSPDGDTFKSWRTMVASGAAECSKHGGLAGGVFMFVLTEAGARASLCPGEALDPEDFPTSR